MENKSDDIVFKTFLPPPSNKSYCRQESFQRIFVAATMQLILIASSHSITRTHCSERSRSCNIFIWSTSAINVIHLFGKKKMEKWQPNLCDLKILLTLWDGVLSWWELGIHDTKVRDAISLPKWIAQKKNPTTLATDCCVCWPCSARAKRLIVLSESDHGMALQFETCRTTKEDWGLNEETLENFRLGSAKWNGFRESYPWHYPIWLLV